MLSFEYKLPISGALPEELEVSLDKEGLALLLEGLTFLSTGRTEHIHLMGKSWGGVELDELASKDGISIKHVKIMLR